MFECWVNVKGVKIRYLEAGRENDEIVILVHGLGSASDRWQDLPKQLSSKFHTISIDLPGFGESDKPKDASYTIKYFRDFIVYFAETLGINNNKTSLIGHSLGGFIALESVIQNRIRVEKLILIDSSGLLTKPTPILIDYFQAATSSDKKMIRMAFEKMVADPKRVPFQLVESFFRRINLPNAKNSFKLTLENSTNTQVDLRKLMEVKIPTLIVWGKQDLVIPIEHSKIFNQSIKNSKIHVIEDAGHAPFAEKPQQVGEIIREFLETTKPKKV